MQRVARCKRIFYFSFSAFSCPRDLALDQQTRGQFGRKLESWQHRVVSLTAKYLDAFIYLDRIADELTKRLAHVSYQRPRVDAKRAAGRAQCLGKFDRLGFFFD